MTFQHIDNPFRPGAGHRPPYLAGRTAERARMRKLLTQTTVIENLVLTGLWGIGKTALLDTFKPLAQEAQWWWVGNDLSAAASISEQNLATRLLTDVSLLTSRLVVGTVDTPAIGFAQTSQSTELTLNFAMLKNYFDNAPGLVEDKLKATLAFVWSVMSGGELPVRGIVFAYDEAQHLADHVEKEQYPLSMLLDVFQSLQRHDVPFMLVLTGLPTLLPKLVKARAYAEQMFDVCFLDTLTEDDAREAIVQPMQQHKDYPFSFPEKTVAEIVKLSTGYPYFLQYICKEVFDMLVALTNAPESVVCGNTALGWHKQVACSMQEIMRKFDLDFFEERWQTLSDQQRQWLLTIATAMPAADHEFTLQEITQQSNANTKAPFSTDDINQMLASLTKHGVIYQNRYGKYAFAVPLLVDFIRRQAAALRPVDEADDVPSPIDDEPPTRKSVKRRQSPC